MLTLERKAVHYPVRQDNIVKLPINRSFYLKPGDVMLSYVPMRSSHDVILHPALHPTPKASSGLQKAGQFTRFYVKNISAEMVHVVDKVNLTCFQPGRQESWTIVHRGRTSVLSFQPLVRV